MRWSEYAVSERLPYWLLADAPRTLAKNEFEEGLRDREKRIEQLSSLARANDLSLSVHDATSVRQLNDFFISAVESNPFRPSVPDARSYSLCEDISWLLGEEMIRRNPNLRWELFTWGKRNVAYHCPYVTGFASVPEKFHFGYDLIQLVTLYATEVLGSRGYFDPKSTIVVRGQKIVVDPGSPARPPLERDYFNFLLNAAAEVNGRKS